MITAREKFTKYGRVRVTAEGLVFLTPPPGKPMSKRGSVVGFGHRKNVVRVLRDGHAQPESINMDFVDPC